MKKEQIMGVIRHILTFGGGLLVAHGVIDEAVMLELVGAFTTISGAAWSYFSSEKKLYHGYSS